MLLSGGLDSSTCLAIARAQRWRCHAISFDYGQRHRHELVAAAAVAGAIGVAQHLVVEIDLRSIGGSALTDTIDVPKDRDEQQIGGGVPVTYVPARNTIFLSFALAWAEVLRCRDIFIGVNALDYSGYPDCRPEYIAAFEQLAAHATADGGRWRIHAPLMELNKAQIIARGLELGVDYGATHSCYDPGPDGRPYGGCDACLLRAKGFAEAGARDPLRRRFR